VITLRRSDERGFTRLAWLDSRHTFSFDQYYDPAHMGFRGLRVINEDRVGPGGGFPTHPHRDMEIITYVLEGALEHRDSMGNGSLIRPGEVQRMSAGTGITHSEYNASKTEPVHLLQIWLLPRERGIRPSYQQETLDLAGDVPAFRLIASPDGRDGSVRILQDTELLAARLKPGQTAAHALRPGRHAWVQVARGQIALNGETLVAGDGAAVGQESEIRIEAGEAAEVLLFDLA
jgi:quercetin 2,3-dioxygenase